MTDAPTITRDQLKKHIDANKGDYLLIDVRSYAELEYGTIPTARHILLADVDAAFDLSPKEFLKKYNFPKPDKKDKVIFYCKAGGRSKRAANLVKSKGYNAYNFTGSFDAWAQIDENLTPYSSVSPVRIALAHAKQLLK